MTTNARPLPYAIDAEEAVLGSLLLDPAAIARVGFLQAADFYREKHRWLYDILLSLWDSGTPPDTVTVCAELEAQKLLDKAGGVAFISGLTLHTPTAIHVEHYARIVAETSARRRLIAAGENIARMGYEADAPLSTLEEKAEKELAAARRRESQNLSHVASAARQGTDVLESIRAGTEHPALPVSLPALAELIGGWFRGEQTILAANTNVGKTSYAVHEAIYLARQGYGVVFVSVEMYKHDLARRMKANLGRLDLAQLRHGFRHADTATDAATGRRKYPHRRASWEELLKDSRRTDEELAALPIHVIAPELDKAAGRVVTPDFSAHSIRAEIRGYAERHKLDFIIVDYLSNLDYPETRSIAERSLIVGDASFTLRKLAIETEAHVLLLHQLRPDAIQARYPTHFHFEESKKVAMNADNALVLIAPALQGDMEASVQAREMNISKGRNERTGLVEGVELDGAIGYWSDSETRHLAASEMAFSRNGHHHEKEFDDVMF